MSDGRRARLDLLETVEAQEETIRKYEKRLKDVVAAYKGLAKEKEAIEASFKAVTGGGDAGQRASEPAGEAEEAGSSSSVPGSAAASDVGSEAATDEMARLRDKVSTLSKTVMTLTSEKGRLEATFQEDRRRLVQERQEREAALKEARAEVEAAAARHKADLEEAKSKFIVERHSREKEASDHQMSLRELQRLLADERRAREKVETELQEAAAKARTRELNSAKQDGNWEARLAAAEARVKAKAEEADALKARLKAPSPEAERLKAEVSEVREEQRRSLERAEQRVEEAEKRAARARLEQEQRVTSLESRLGELSETVGTYDRLRTHDQAEISKLRDRIAQLGEENATLARTSGGANSPDGGDDFHGLDMAALMDKYKVLKERLREANSKASAPVDLEEFFSDDEVTLRLRRQLDALRREFDLYKRSPRGGSPPGVGGTGGKYLLPEVDQEVVHSLKTQVAELEERGRLLSSRVSELNSEVALGKEREAHLSKVAQEAREEGQRRLEAQDAEYKAKISDLEAEFAKQRDRCTTLIEEKEDEVSMLKSNMELAFETAFAGGQGGTGAGQLQRAAATLARSVSVGSTGSAGRRSRKSSHVAGVGDLSLLDEVTEGLKSSSQSDGMVLHYEQEISRKNVEISQLRQQVFDVESAMRELQMSFVSKEERYSERLERAEEEVARLKRRQVSQGADSGASMEYLKNVVFNYMVSSDANSRDHMLKAIGAVLIFSAAEVKQVRDYNKAWWKPVKK